MGRYAMGIYQMAFLAILTVEGLAQLTFLTQPQDATVVEGGNATFQCTGEENGRTVQFIWDFAPAGGELMSVITGSQLAGVSSVTVNSDRTQLTLSEVQREVDGARVMCSAIGSTGNVDSNPANVIVQFPPSAPQAINVSAIGPFSATVSWQPPLEDGGAVGPLMYTVTLTNTSYNITFNLTAALTLNLTNLTHSVTYRVQVVAGHEAGVGPAAEYMFRTDDTGVLIVLVAQRNVTINPVGALTVVEGKNLTITCTDRNEMNLGSTLRLREDCHELTGSREPLSFPSRNMRTFALPVDRKMNANLYDCFSTTEQYMPSERIILTVAWNDPISLNPSTASVLDKEVNISITLNANPPPTITLDRMDGMEIWEKDSRVTIGSAFIVFRSLIMKDATTYIVKAENEAGSKNATFRLTSPPSASAGSSGQAVVAGASVGASGLFLIFAVGIIIGIPISCFFCRKKRSKSVQKCTEKKTGHSSPSYELKETSTH